ncbi:MAG: hypothetical protein Q9220_002913 [cf. Caloplaca sp. 1 TL-2023]
MDTLFSASNPALALLHSLTTSQPQPTTIIARSQPSSSLGPFFLTIAIISAIFATFVLLFTFIAFLSDRHSRIMNGTHRPWSWRWNVEWDRDPRVVGSDSFLDPDEEGEPGRAARVPLLNQRERNRFFDAV